ncbi:MAG: DUF4115 domain-containing protein [Candidatus Omnitrophica bacterium]|nr:DUF4115 domain-containing protein [Candidatus Omnitrophota bacterium]
MIDALGKIFKDARRGKGLSIGQVCKKTKVNHNIISAIEEDNFEALNPVYMKSFIKIYARFLGLDAEEVISKYCEYMQLEPEKHLLREKLKKDESKLEPLESKSLRTLIDEGILRDISKLFRGKKKFFITILFILISVVLLNYLFFARIKKAPIKSVGLKEKIVKDSKLTKQSIVKFKDSLRLSVRAKKDCWMRVRVDGKLIFQTTLKKGEVESWQAKEKIELKLGNPAGVDLELNGELLEQFGRRSSKSRYATITKEGIKIAR